MRYLRWVGLASILTAASAGAESTNQWYPRGPEGGAAHAVAIDQTSHALIAGYIAGIFRYDAPASVWGFSTSGAPTPRIDDIATTATATFVNSGGYVTRSTDGPRLPPRPSLRTTR